MSTPNTKISFEEADKIFKGAKNIFFIGIGGISMGALAEYCAYLGKSVRGYDAVRNSVCAKLEKTAKITYRSDTDNVLDADVVVYTGAISEENLELKKARERKIPIISRANLLGYFVSKFKRSIGVGGTHGKSTTTAMIAHIFAYACCDPTVFCGAVMNFTSSPYLFGRGESVIFEACEYLNSFHSFHPTDAVVTNIDFDHPDCFKDIDEIKESFALYVSGAKTVYVNADDENSKDVTKLNKDAKTVTFGFDEKCDYRAKIKHTEGKNVFEVFVKGKTAGECELEIFGEHNVKNAICALAVSCENGISPSVAIEALKSFDGTQRRLQLFGKNKHGVVLFSDYAHHPTEIKASLDAISDMGYKRIICLFQPHTYSRTKALYSEFTKAFSKAEKLYVLPSYSAREENDGSVSEIKFATDSHGTYIPSFEKAKEIMEDANADAVCVMGAGDIEKLTF